MTYIECILDVAKYQYLLKGNTHIPNVILLPLQFCWQGIYRLGTFIWSGLQPCSPCYNQWWLCCGLVHSWQQEIVAISDSFFLIKRVYPSNWHSKIDMENPHLNPVVFHIYGHILNWQYGKSQENPWFSTSFVYPRVYTELVDLW